MITVDLSGAKDFFREPGPDYAAAAEAHRLLAGRAGPGNEFTGWLDLPEHMIGRETKAIVNAAQKIKRLGNVLVVVGIGGSYLGARAAIELLKTPSHNAISDAAEVYFMGNNLSPDAINELVSIIGDRDFCVNVISKSGGTLEPALGYRVAKSLLERKYGRATAKKHMFITTDAKKGILHDIAEAEGYETFSVPDDVGGRYSVLSPVGLLPMAAAGIDIEAVVVSAIDAIEALTLRSPDNPAWQYAAARQHLYRNGKSIEILSCYEPSFRYMAEWWKQLFGESEGKNGIGIFPASVEYTADLHSMGQYIQDGARTLMETVVSFKNSRSSCTVPFEMGDPDGLNYLAGRDFSDICRVAKNAVKAAHISGGVPNLEITADHRDEAGFAELVCFFEVSCAISAYMSGVNPFDQPGVEAYKTNMFQMLKPQ